jgi:hypothetical protein
MSTDDPTIAERPPLTDEQRAEMRAKAAENVRRAMSIFEADEQAQLAAFMTQIRALAAKQTGMTVEELEAAAAVEALQPPEPLPVPAADPAKLARRRMVSAGVPELYIQAVADRQPIACPALDATRTLLAARGGFLVLSGGIGTRKTGSAAWLLSQCERGEYLEAHELLSIAFEDKARYLRIVHAPVIVLDEIKGVEDQLDAKGHWRRIFDPLFNHWYASCARVVITCNLTPEQFAAVIGERAFDRLQEKGVNGGWFDVPGESVRAQLGSSRAR